MSRARAVAGANIALAKYWGKLDIALNIPAVPSISLTLDKLTTTTTIEFHSGRADSVTLNGKRATGSGRTRVIELLDRVREQAGLDAVATVVSDNNFPTAAGLASSASGFAALAGAALSAGGLQTSQVAISRLARQSSASAARSVFPGFAELPTGRAGDGRLAAKPLFPARHWDVALVIALTDKGPKKVGSTEGMERSRKTSPLYAPWLQKAPALAKKVRDGLRDRDLAKLGVAMEQSTVMFHACAMTSVPSVYYWQPATIAALKTIQKLREKGTEVYATMDAGPHLKALCRRKDAPSVKRALQRLPGVHSTLVARPGPGIKIQKKF